MTHVLSDCFQEDDLELTYFLLSPDDKVCLLHHQQLYFDIELFTYQYIKHVPASEM